MRVLLIADDAKFPNLALMKLSAWHKAQGDEVGKRMADPDKVYMSAVFEDSLPHFRGIAKFYPGVDWELGGPALGSLNIVKNLPHEIEHIMPDYSLYGIDYSIGFSTRGCIRKCPFCQVHRIEGEFREHAPIEEFHDPSHKKLILFDNNFLASEKWKEKLDYIRTRDLKVCFEQGLDARLVTREIAKELKRVKSFNVRFTKGKMYFAWDLMHEETELLRGLRYIIEAGRHPGSIIVFMLCGYNTTHEQDLYRFNRLRELGVDPFVMIYDNRKDDPWIRHFSRWVNRWIFRSVPFEKYKGGVLIE